MSKRSIKENPLIKSKKAGIKGNSGSEEGNEIIKFVIIIAILVVLVGGIYGLTLLFSKDNNEYKYEVKEGKINYDTVNVGTILNRQDNEYYVLVFDSTNYKASEYSTVMSLYNDKKNDDNSKLIKMFYCDLNDELNKKYYNVNNDNKSNPKASKVSDFDFGDITLLHVKKGKITEYIEDYKTIQQKLL